MPHPDMLNIRMFLANFRDAMTKSLRKALLISFELCHSAFKLRLVLVVLENVSFCDEMSMGNGLRVIASCHQSIGL